MYIYKYIYKTVPWLAFVPPTEPGTRPTAPTKFEPLGLPTRLTKFAAAGCCLIHE